MCISVYFPIGKLFDALVCFLIFNCADFVGRYLSNWFKMVRNCYYKLFIISFPTLCLFTLPLFLSLPRLVDGVLCY